MGYISRPNGIGDHEEGFSREEGSLVSAEENGRITGWPRDK
ncbi:hypothetical protein Tco_0781587, partial [Tanacetum coccineum]